MKEEVNRHLVPNVILLGEVKKLIAEGHHVVIKVKGSSMLPFIVGGRDSVSLVQPADLKVGDIVLAEIKEGNFVLHRIKAINGYVVTLMGDGNLCGTERCSKEDVAGKVEMILRNGKEVNPCSCAEKFKVNLWLMMLPLRRWLLAIYRRMPV